MFFWPKIAGFRYFFRILLKICALTVIWSALSANHELRYSLLQCLSISDIKAIPLVALSANWWSTIEPNGRKSVKIDGKIMKLPILGDFWSKIHLTGKVIKAEWWKMLVSNPNPLDTILHIFASSWLKKGYSLSLTGQKWAKIGII